MTMPKFNAIVASAIGSSHEKRGEEKQDSVNTVKDKKGNIAFCLSDGAGSSKLSKLSSQMTVQHISNTLINLPKEIEKKGVGSWINDFVVRSILDLRENFFSEFGTYDLRDYHCTLVAGVIFDGNCLLAHIGDGAIIAGTCMNHNSVFALNDTLFVSEAENGEYKNETFFVTEPHWLSHLRIKFVPEVDWIIAGTDGGLDLISNGDRINDHYVSELLSAIINKPERKQNQVLRSYLTSPDADQITNDDKSLIVCLSREIVAADDHFWDDDADSFERLYPVPVRGNADQQVAHDKNIQPSPNQPNLDKSKNRFTAYFEAFKRALELRPALTSVVAVILMIAIYSFVFGGDIEVQSQSSLELETTLSPQMEPDAQDAIIEQSSVMDENSTQKEDELDVGEQTKDAGIIEQNEEDLVNFEDESKEPIANEAIVQPDAVVPSEKSQNSNDK